MASGTPSGSPPAETGWPNRRCSLSGTHNNLTNDYTRCDICGTKITDYKLAFNLWDTGKVDRVVPRLASVQGLHSPYVPVWVEAMVKRQG